MTNQVGDAPPRVTVIIATYNRARMLRCAIRSVLQQTYRHFELIVSGDACTDDSSDLVRSFSDSRIRWMNRSERCGSQWGPNNDAIAVARGDSIAFLGHDDLWLPWHLAQLLTLLEEGADLGHSLVAMLGPEGLREVSGKPPKRERYGDFPVPPSGWLLRKEVLRQLGGFRDADTISRGTDHDLLRRLERARFRIVDAPRISVVKFPSHWWRAYAADATTPQERWMERIEADPQDVERELNEWSAGLTWPTSPTWKRWLRRLADLLEQNGLIASLQRTRFRKRRVALKAKRGL